jgi:hypothetical protein
MGTIAEQLFNDYNNLRLNTSYIKKKRDQGCYVASISRKHLATFESLVQWCEEHNVESRRWLYSLFVIRHWIYPPKLNQLKSTKHLKRFQTIELPGYSERLQVENTAVLRKEGRVFDRKRDITKSAELLKRRYVQWGFTDRCIAEMEESTFGYHPKSDVCQACPSRFECARILQGKVKYDIMSLRLGIITAEQARVAEYYDRGTTTARC